MCLCLRQEYSNRNFQTKGIVLHPSINGDQKRKTEEQSLEQEKMRGQRGPLRAIEGVGQDMSIP